MKKAYLFAYGVPFLIVVINVSVTAGYLDTLTQSQTCNGGKKC